MESLDELERAARGWITFTRFDEIVPYKLSRAEWVRYEEAKVKGYVVSPGRRPNLLHVWWKHAALIGRPYVAVVGTAKNPKVELDLIEVGRLSEEGARLARCLLNGARRRGKGPGRYDAYAGKVAVSIPVSPEDAELVAAQLLDIALEHVMDTPRP